MSKKHSGRWTAERKARYARRHPEGVNSPIDVNFRGFKYGSLTYRGVSVKAIKLTRGTSEAAEGTVFRMDRGEARYIPATPTIATRFRADNIAPERYR